MIGLDPPALFADWRAQARSLLAGGIDPATVSWEGAGLFSDPLPHAVTVSQRKVSAAYLKLAETVFMHRDPARLALLYRLLWRTGAAPRLLDDASDADVAQARHLAQGVRRDIHKMRAFVRFRELPAQDDGAPCFVAWYEPDHHIVRANARFFTGRFANMRWSILTPELCLHWDGTALTEAPGATRADAPVGDASEDLWRSYYAAIFNPARLKIDAMTREMPRRFWRNMPETSLIPELIAGAQARSAAMIALGAGPGEPPPGDWQALQAGIATCTRCPLHCHATQPVHGEGPRHAALAIVGEQPGDQEDLAGHPFIGPAGQLLDQHLAPAGIVRSQSYLTNAVKHFKFTQRGKQRIHQNPTAGEIDHCRWWLDAEIGLLKPRVIVALGASAARGILGRTINISATRGAPQTLASGAQLVVTTHPAYILRLGEGAAQVAAQANFQSDLRLAATLLAA
jgi:probable DNA metabolism protein